MLYNISYTYSSCEDADVHQCIRLYTKKVLYTLVYGIANRIVFNDDIQAERRQFQAFKVLCILDSDLAFGAVFGRF